MLLLHVLVLALSAALWILALPDALARGHAAALAVSLPGLLMVALYALLLAAGRLRVEAGFRLAPRGAQTGILIACAGAPLLWLLLAA